MIADATLERLADLTEGLPFDEFDDDAMLIERAIILAQEFQAAARALQMACRETGSPVVPTQVAEAIDRIIALAWP